MNMSFQVQNVGLISGTMGFESHRHPESLEFHLFSRGRGHYVEGDRRVRIDGPRLLLTDPGKDHRYVQDPTDSRQEWYFLKFRPVGSATGAKVPFLGGFREGGGFVVGESVRSLFQRMVDQWTSCRAATQHYFLGFLAEMEAMMAKGRFPQQDPHTEGLCTFIREHLHRPIRLDEAAQRIGVTKTHLIRLFRRSTGTTPIQWSNQLRIQMALSLLGTSSMSLEEIAPRLGFRDVYYFI